jgi:MOSC domain-containing protein YiiM
LSSAVEGLAGDVQADRRVHGGPEKALHQYAVDNYRRLAEQSCRPSPRNWSSAASARTFPPLAVDEKHGLSSATSSSLGRARIQVSQPRSPCWKIDHRYGHDGVARLIAETGLTGWYYRVLEAATISTGDRNSN